jgi:hypothetical protein
MPFFRMRTELAGTVKHWVGLEDNPSGLFSSFLALINTGNNISPFVRASNVHFSLNDILQKSLLALGGFYIS